MLLEYYAHYDKEKRIKQLLCEHLAAVARAAQEKIPTVVKFKSLNNQELKTICYWLGYFHDLGKYTDYFQRYLLYEIESALKNHAHISACFIYNFLQQKLFPTGADLTGKIILFLSYLTVRLHHLNLRTNGLFSIENERRIWHEVEEIEKHLKNKVEEIIIDLGLEKEIPLEEFAGYLQIESLRKKSTDFKLIPQLFQTGRIQEPEWYFFLVYLFSLLIDLDKLDAAELKPKKTITVSPEKVNLYLRNKQKGVNTLNTATEYTFLDLREKARRSIMAVVDALTDDEIRNTRFFLLTAPTGIGKTLSSLQCALRLQERIKQIEDYTPRIITAIPFINIIEQHRKDYEQVFGQDVDLIVHHRLSDFSARDNEQEEIPIDKALLEVESWEGDVILTTFVQLFQSIFTGNNRLLKKVNKLAGSIVIIDEAQAVPDDYMPLVGAVLQKMAEYYGTRFILMTATQPKLLEFGTLLNPEGKKLKPVTLLPDYEQYFQKLKRTKLIPLLEKKRNTEQFLELFFEKWDQKSSVLIVVNTIKRSIDIFNEINKALKEQKIKARVYYLSTNIIPKKRRKVINIVEKRLKKRKNSSSQKPVILVSTQTIEAGVDLDFDMAFRDLAPLDSIIQTAGRVNREGKKGSYLPVYIIQLEADSHYIYPFMQREDTIKLLTQQEEILEPEYGKLTEEYYANILKRGVKDKKLWEEGILKLDFDVIQEFRLIKELGDVYDVFVEDGSKMATALADVYQNLLNFKDNVDPDKMEIIAPHLKKMVLKPLGIYERKALLKLVSAKMSDYIIQVRVKKLITNRPPSFEARGGVSSPIFWIPPAQRKSFYNEKTGFISDSKEVFVW
jgi:CRISPR-associated endonuclease/helicase Cas3